MYDDGMARLRNPSHISQEAQFYARSSFTEHLCSMQISYAPFLREPVIITHDCFKYVRMRFPFSLTLRDVRAWGCRWLKSNSEYSNEHLAFSGGEVNLLEFSHSNHFERDDYVLCFFTSAQWQKRCKTENCELYGFSHVKLNHGLLTLKQQTQQ